MRINLKEKDYQNLDEVFALFKEKDDQTIINECNKIYLYNENLCYEYEKLNYELLHKFIFKERKWINKLSLKILINKLLRISKKYQNILDKGVIIRKTRPGYETCGKDNDINYIHDQNEYMAQDGVGKTIEELINIITNNVNIIKKHVYNNNKIEIPINISSTLLNLIYKIKPDKLNYKDIYYSLIDIIYMALFRNYPFNHCSFFFKNESEEELDDEA